MNMPSWITRLHWIIRGACLAGLGVCFVSGCELPADPDAAADVEVVEPKVKAPATTPYGKAMEAATKLRDEKVPEYNERLEKLADPFAK